MKKKKSNLPFEKGQVVMSGITTDGKPYHVGLNYTGAQWKRLSKEKRQKEITEAIRQLQVELATKRFLDFITAANMLKDEVNLDKVENVPEHIQRIYDLAKSVVAIDETSRINHKCGNPECHGCYGLN